MARLGLHEMLRPILLRLCLIAGRYEWEHNRMKSSPSTESVSVSYAESSFEGVTNRRTLTDAARHAKLRPNP